MSPLLAFLLAALATAVRTAGPYPREGPPPRLSR